MNPKMTRNPARLLAALGAANDEITHEQDAFA
jgi:hypothetical protein